jgi:hypothetical protein
MEGAVYIFCAITAAGCAFLLLNSYRRNGVRLLFWSGLCFSALAIENLILFFDLVEFPQIDLSNVWLACGLLGSIALLYGLIWENH